MAVPAGMPAVTQKDESWVEQVPVVSVLREKSDLQGFDLMAGGRENPPAEGIRPRCPRLSQKALV
jgi:hypothetical protein